MVYTWLPAKPLDRQERAVGRVPHDLHLPGHAAQRNNRAENVWKRHRGRIALRCNGCFHLDRRCEHRGIDGEAKKRVVYVFVDEAVFRVPPIEHAKEHIGVMSRMNEALDVIAWWEVIRSGSLRSVPQRLLDDVEDHWRRALVVPFVGGLGLGEFPPANSKYGQTSTHETRDQQCMIAAHLVTTFCGTLPHSALSTKHCVVLLRRAAENKLRECGT